MQQKYQRISFENKREMVVIEGQPFYKSTGENSGLPGTWFPFVMMCGSKLHHKFENIIKYPGEMQHVMEKEIEAGYRNRFKLPIRDTGSQPYYTTDIFFFFQHKKFEYKKKEPDGSLLIKADSGVINSDEIDLNFMKLNEIFEAFTGNDDGSHRICRKKDLIISMRLGGGIWVNPDIKHQALNLLHENERELTNIPVELDNNIIRQDNPDEINDWLFDRGANTLKELYGLNMTIRSS